MKKKTLVDSANIMNHEQKIKKYIKDNRIKAEHLSFKQSCHSVREAAEAANCSEDDFVKSICMISEGKLIVAIVKGEDKASTTKVSKELGIQKIRTATPEEMLELTGYPCGGTPAFGYDATFFIDEKVMEKQTVYSGGGTQNSLIKCSPQEMIKANKGRVADIKK